MTNLFLTGERQIGKSTIINRIIKDYPGKIVGFKTMVDETTNRKFFICSIHDKNIDYRNAYIGEWIDNEKLVSYPETFEQVGMSILTRCLKDSPDLIVMDELGVMENNATNFQQAVFQCLDSPVPVIGVLKNKSSAFLDAIRNRNDVEIYTVSKDNRDKLLNVLNNRLSSL